MISHLYSSLHIMAAWIMKAVQIPALHMNDRFIEGEPAPYLFPIERKAGTCIFHIGIHNMIAFPAPLLLQFRRHIKMKQIDHDLNAFLMKGINDIMIMCCGKRIQLTIPSWKHTAPANGNPAGIVSCFLQESNIFPILCIESGSLLRPDSVMKFLGLLFKPDIPYIFSFAING